MGEDHQADLGTMDRSGKVLLYSATVRFENRQELSFLAISFKHSHRINSNDPAV